MLQRAVRGVWRSGKEGELRDEKVEKQSVVSEPEASGMDE